MKKESNILIFISVFLSLFILSSCTKPQKRESITGTYKLTTYITEYKNKETVDRIEKYGAEKYIIVNKNDTGYYIIKNDDIYETKEVKLNFSYDEDGLCEKVVLIDGKNNELSYNIISINNEPAFESKYTQLFSHTTTQRFSKLNNSTSLEELAKSIGADLSYVTFEQYKYDGTYVSDLFNVVNFDTIYDFFYLHTDTLKVDKYIKYKDGNESVTTVDVVEESDGFIIDDKKFYKRYDDETKIYYLEYNEVIYYCFGTSSDDVIDQYEEQYQDYLNDEND